MIRTKYIVHLTCPLHGLPHELVLVEVVPGEGLRDLHRRHRIGVAPEEQQGEVEAGEGRVPAGLEAEPGLCIGIMVCAQRGKTAQTTTATTTQASPRP